MFTIALGLLGCYALLFSNFTEYRIEFNYDNFMKPNITILYCSYEKFEIDIIHCKIKN